MSMQLINRKFILHSVDKLKPQHLSVIFQMATPCKFTPGICGFWKNFRFLALLLVRNVELFVSRKAKELKQYKTLILVGLSCFIFPETDEFVYDKKTSSAFNHLHSCRWVDYPFGYMKAYES
ncbi:uncharacterized protein ACO6RY_09109 [Pungitius sinensis]